MKACRSQCLLWVRSGRSPQPPSTAALPPQAATRKALLALPVASKAAAIAGLDLNSECAMLCEKVIAKMRG